jgi:hypothetical protein
MLFSIATQTNGEVYFIQSSHRQIRGQDGKMDMDSVMKFRAILIFWPKALPLKDMLSLIKISKIQPATRIVVAGVAVIVI